MPSALRLAPASYDARLNLSNELQGWPEAVAAVREEAAEVRSATRDAPEPINLAVAGPHWVICAQLEAALRGELPVGCNTPVADDFDDWWPRTRWGEADVILWVSDGRFGPPLLPGYVRIRRREVGVERAGRLVRLFTISILARRAQA